VLRCGTLRHRFSQIDMLSLDVFWRGHNVIVDPGSYLYNGPPRWHDHFYGTAAHSTVQVDGRDQMLHYRRFKSLYPAPASRLAFEDAGAYALVEGEHRGYARHPGGCVHRRAVLFVKDDLWVIVDRIAGEGTHRARLHWLCGDYPHRHDPITGAVELETPAGPFWITVHGASSGAAEVVRGESDPPRGWLSRHYGEKVPVPSFSVSREGALPIVFVTVLSAGRPEIQAAGDRLAVTCRGRGGERPRRVDLRVAEGRICDVRLVDGMDPGPERPLS
jgi:asparagine synthase (glutamine-hydrolysing)